MAPRVLEPAVSSDELDLLLRAGLRACDHGRLSHTVFYPTRGWGSFAAWRSDESLSSSRFGRCVEEAIVATKNKALRAPTLLSVIFCPQDHEKIPYTEQLVTAVVLAVGHHSCSHAWDWSNMALVKRYIPMKYQERSNLIKMNKSSQ